MIFVINDAQNFNDMMKHLMDTDYPYRVELTTSDTRSLQANALYWKWMSVLASAFMIRAKSMNRKNKDKPDFVPVNDVFSKDDMHYLMKYKFLGYENKKIGSTEIQTLRSSSKLSVHEFCQYMNHIDKFAIEQRIELPTPADNYYHTWRLENETNEV